MQLDGISGFSGTTVDEQVVILDDLQETVTSRLVIVETELVEMEPQLLELQEDLQEAEAEYNRLQLNRDVAQETYRSLARKVDEERITSNDMTRGIRLASNAAVPERPEGPRKLFIMAIAGVIAAVIAIAVLVFYQWWRSSVVN